MRKTVKLLFAEQDRAALQPLLDELRKKGLRCVALTGEARKNDVVFAVLSEAFYADGAAVAGTGQWASGLGAEAQVPNAPRRHGLKTQPRWNLPV